MRHMDGAGQVLSYNHTVIRANDDLMQEMFSLFFNDKEKAALWLGQEAVRWWENHWSSLNTL